MLILLTKYRAELGLTEGLLTLCGDIEPVTSPLSLLQDYSFFLVTVLVPSSDDIQDIKRIDLRLIPSTTRSFLRRLFRNFEDP